MSLKDQIEQGGRFPPLSLLIKPLGGAQYVVLSNFISYQFDSSILIPVDTFSFTYAIPDDKSIWSDNFREGDIVTLYCGGQLLATGLIDTIDVEVDEHGQRINVTGRDLMGQLEDQEMVSLDSTMVFGNNTTIDQVFQYLRVNTRIPGLRKQQTVDIDAMKPAPLFATAPGESKLAALTRYLEPLNCVAWMDPDGTLVIGRPNMAQDISGVIAMDHKNRWSNCLAMKASFSSATIPNLVVPVWAGQEVATRDVVRAAPQQVLKNLAFGPSRLLSLGHRLSKTVVVSNPQATNPQGFSDVNRFRAGGQNILQAYAKREVARENVRERMVQVTMPGHLDNDGNPFRVDRTWVVNFPRAVAAPFQTYCASVQYKLAPEPEGQRTNMSFVNLGTIVSDVKVQR